MEVRGQFWAVSSLLPPWVPEIERFTQHGRSLYQLASPFISERIKGQLSIVVNIYEINVKLSGFLCS